MQRDFETFQKWHDWHKTIELNDFTKAKEKAISDAEKIIDEKGRKSQLRIANKMQFQFDKSKLLNYGNCTKFDKPVSFIPETCQIDTQKCFEHRKQT